MNDEEEKIEKILDIPGLGPTTAQKLADAGIDSLMSLAVTPIETLSDLTGVTEAKCRKFAQTARDALEMGFLDVASYDEESEKYYISFGSKEFNTLVGGGLKSGIITEVHGEFSSGKTQIGHQLVVNALKQFDEGVVIYIDTENTFTKSRIKEMALAIGFDEDELEERVFKRIRMAKAYTSDHQILLAQELKKVVQKEQVVLVIVDSVMAHFRSEYVGRGTLATRQQKLSQHLSELAVFADVNNVPVFITNQVSANPAQMYGDPMQAVGGTILGHAAKIRLKIRRGKKDGDSGSLRVAKLIDHPSRPDGEVTYRITTAGLEDI